MEPARNNNDRPRLSDSETQQLRRLSRRAFSVAGAAGGLTLLGIFGLPWLGNENGVPWPLRRALEWNGRLWAAGFRGDHLAPEFDAALALMPRVNGQYGLQQKPGAAPFDLATWRMHVQGIAGGQQDFSLDQIKALPRYEHVTELKCIEGWSTVVSWAGARMSDFAALCGLATRSGGPVDLAKQPADAARYIGLHTPDKKYYVGLDMASGMHPQTLLCYEMDGRPLTAGHGAPLRLVIPVKYGIKNIKRIGTIRFTDDRPADYWAERGYDWHAGL